MTGPLEPTNQWYAVAKIASIKLCQAYRRQFGLDFVAVTPTNLYGPGDNFDLASGHVVPALLRKVHEAKAAGLETVEIWGSGKPRREFLYVEDCADGWCTSCGTILARRTSMSGPARTSPSAGWPMPFPRGSATTGGGVPLRQLQAGRYAAQAA